MKCKSCHWFYDESMGKPRDPFEVMSNGKIYPCNNIGESGWEYWSEYQTEPPECPEYCKKGEYVPTGIWAGVAEVVKEVAKIVKE